MSVETRLVSNLTSTNGATHLPLRRILARPVVQPSATIFAPSSHLKCNNINQTVSKQRNGEFGAPETHDSCYSSCSEDSSHNSLSREPSDSVIQAEFRHLSVTNSPHYEFATKLGYNEQQLQQVIDKLGSNAGQDQILSELVKLGRGILMNHRRYSNNVLPATTAPSLRSIVIDGSNIAMTHGRKEVFSCRGIRDCVQFFQDRGHTDIIVFVPQFRRETARSDCPITDQHILFELEDENILVWTPSRRIGGRRIVCHDDRYILKTAEEKDAVVVSNDEYRDLIKENSQYRRLVEERLLMYSFVDGKFMPPDDPLGRHGPTLAQFLSNGILTISSQLCPYARKCTYGNKCKFYHPERPNGVHVSVTERLIKDRQQRTLLACPSQLADVSSTSSSTDRVGISRTQSLNIPFHDGLWSQHSFNEPIPVGPQKLRLNMHPKNMMQQQQQQHGQQRQVNQHLTAIRAAHPELYQHANLDRQFSAPSTAGNRPRLIATTQPPLTPLSAPLLDTPTNQFFYDQPQIPPHHHLYRNSFAHCNPSSCPTVNNDTHLDGYNNGGTKYMATNMFFSDEAYQSQENKSSHLFSPSTAVWGESKLSVGPLMRSAINVEPVQQQSPSMCNIANRDHLRTLLSQLFPERVVLAVLDANPNETDPRKLCAQIVEQQKRFGN